MASWRLAPALEQMRREADAIAPDRSRRSDGTIGDAAHAARRSDHNPDDDGLVTALDLTHDPAGGWDAHARVEQIRRRQDPRVSYLISNDRIAGPGAGGWEWRPYRPGVASRNRHTQHAHVSVTQAGKRSIAPWWPEFEARSLSPPTPLRGGRYMRQMIPVGKLDAQGRGHILTDIPWDAWVSVDCSDVDPESAGRYGGAYIVHPVDVGGRLKLVVHGGAQGETIAVYVTTV